MVDLFEYMIQLNMFRASSFPSSGATTISIAPSGLLLERGGSSVVGRPRPTALLPPRSNSKPEAATAVYISS
jgi:hypothetical protein